MNLEILSSFIPKKKHANPDDMSAADWAELILDFHQFCKKTMDQIKKDDPKEPFFGERIRELLRYQQNNYYQIIDWQRSDLCVVLEAIEQDDPILSVFRFCWTIGSGLTMYAVLNGSRDLFLCTATFGDEVRERGNKDSVYYATIVTARPLSVDLLSLALKEVAKEPKKSLKIVGQEMMKALYNTVISHFENTQRMETQERINSFKSQFGRDVLAQYAC